MPNKYRNVITAGFHSKKEANRYADLLLLESAGEIRELRKQVPFRLEVNGELICKYIADFAYIEKQPDGSWLQVTEDVKSTITKGLPVFRIKSKLLKALHGIELRLT